MTHPNSKLQEIKARLKSLPMSISGAEEYIPKANANLAKLIKAYEILEAIGEKVKEESGTSTLVWRLMNDALTEAHKVLEGE